MSQYWPQSVENRAALRTAIATLVAVLISFQFHLQTPYWSGMTVVIVTNLYTGSIIDKAMMRIIGTIAGAFLGYFIAGIVANSFVLYLLTCFLLVSVSVYYYNFSAYGYAYLLGALAAFLVTSQVALNPQNAFFVAIWRPVEIGIGVLVSAISVYAIFPNHLKDNVLAQVHDIFDDFSKEFNQLLDCMKQGNLVFDEVALTNLNLKKKLRKATELIGAMNYELGVTQAQTDKLRAFLDSFFNLSRQLQYLIISSPQRNNDVIIQSLPVEQVIVAIQHDLKQLQMTFSNSSVSEIELQTGPAIEALEKQFLKLKGDNTAKNDFISSFIFFTQQVNKTFSLMNALLTRGSVNKTHQIKIISKKQRMRSDFDLIKASIKAGLSVILALGFWFVSNWPGGLNGIISSLVLSIRKNLSEMRDASIHRLLGCFIGGGTALCSLYFVEMNLYDFIIIVFFGVWGFSYFMFKWTKYSYIGLQANIALIITLAQEGGPPMLLDPPLQRLAGVVIGIVASFIVGNVLWRSDIWTTLSRYLRKLSKYVTFNLNQVLLVAEDQMSLHDLANIFWMSRGLIESLENENLSAKKQLRLAQLRKKFETLVIIQATISYILSSIDRENAALTAQLLDLDLSLYEKKLVGLYEKDDSTAGPEFSRQLEVLLTGIEKKPAYSQINDNEIRNLSAYINALSQLALRIL